MGRAAAEDAAPKSEERGGARNGESEARDGKLMATAAKYGKIERKKTYYFALPIP